MYAVPWRRTISATSNIEDPVLEVFHELVERGGYGVPDRLRQVRVDRRSSGVAMTQRLLNQTQMDATLHQVRGVGVPQGLNTLLINRILGASITATTRSTISR